MALVHLEIPARSQDRVDVRGGPSVTVQTVNAGNAGELDDIDTVRHRRYVWAVLACLMIVPIGCSGPPAPPVMAVLPDYELIDSQSRLFGTEQLAGRVYVANFFFTRCTTMCPMLTRSMSSLLRRYREQDIDGIHLVSISVGSHHQHPPDARGRGRKRADCKGRRVLEAGCIIGRSGQLSS